MSLWRRLGDSDAYGSCDAMLGGQAAELKARPRLFPVSARESESPHVSDKWVPSEATGGHQNWGRGLIVALLERKSPGADATGAISSKMRVTVVSAFHRGHLAQNA